MIQVIMALHNYLSVNWITMTYEVVSNTFPKIYIEGFSSKLQGITYPHKFKGVSSSLLSHAMHKGKCIAGKFLSLLS